MANPKILEQKQAVIDEITENVKNSASFILLENNGLTVAETMELRRMLKKSNSELKIYKNTLVARSLKSLNIDLEKELNGPKVFVFGTDMIEPIKTTSNFIKKHPNLEMKIGIVDGRHDEALSTTSMDVVLLRGQTQRLGLRLGIVAGHQ